MVHVIANSQAIWLCMSLLVSTVCGWPSPISLFNKFTPVQRSIPTGNPIPLQWNENYTPKRPHEVILNAYMKFGIELPEHLANFVSADANDSLPGDVSNKSGSEDHVGNPTPAYNQTNDREYLSPLYVGTPPQHIWVDFDTGSADLWLFTANSSKDNPDRDVYAPENSTTSKEVDGATWQITYGDGSSAYGKVYVDTIQLSNSELAIDDATVEVATHVSRGISSDKIMSGLMGLAFNHNSTVRPHQPTILRQLTGQGIDYFSVDIRWQAMSIYNFGHYASGKIKGDLSWQPVNNDSDFWEVYMTTYRIGGENLKYIHSWNIVVDTGTTLALLPEDIVKDYYDAVNGSVYSPEYLGYTFPCDAVLPDFIFGFANDWSEYTVPGHYMNYMPTKDGFCYGGIQSNQGMPFSLMGDVFLKAVYVIFHNTKQAVAFGNKDLNAKAWPYY